MDCSSIRWTKGERLDDKNYTKHWNEKNWTKDQNKRLEEGLDERSDEELDKEFGKRSDKALDARSDEALDIDQTKGKCVGRKRSVVRLFVPPFV